jgi:hypothetical protein
MNVEHPPGSPTQGVKIVVVVLVLVIENNFFSANLPQSPGVKITGAYTANL